MWLILFDTLKNGITLGSLAAQLGLKNAESQGVHRIQSASQT